MPGVGDPPRQPRGVFVTGTDTGVGKSILAAAICAALVERGERVAAFKPAVTGLDEAPGEWGHDHELLASVANAGQSPEDIAPYRFGPPVSPHLAAELAGERIEPGRLVREARDAASSADVVVVEGVGGLLVPLKPGYLVRDFAVDLHLPVLIAARPCLGTINHTLLTVEAARSAGLDARSVVMTPWAGDSEPIALSNRDTVERLAAVSVHLLPLASPSEPSSAASHLPIGDWIGAERR